MTKTTKKYAAMYVRNHKEWRRLEKAHFQEKNPQIKELLATAMLESCRLSGTLTELMR